MNRLERIEGPALYLRLVTSQDAEFIHGLRVNPAFNTHLSEVTGTAADQRRWIEHYKRREADGREYYYVIERRDGMHCGVVRLYDIEDDHFTWGSWILDGNKPPKAALESAFLIYVIGFDLLDTKRALFDVRKENDHTLAFHHRFGAIQIDDDERNVYFEYPGDRFAADRERFSDILCGKAI